MIKMNEEVKITCDNDVMKYSPDQIYDKFDDLQTREQKLQNNWNELKKWLIQLQKFKGINQQGFSWGVAQEVLDKMQELEQGKDDTNI